MTGTDETRTTKGRRVKVGRSIRVDGVTVTVEAIEGNEVRLRIDDATKVEVVPKKVD